MGTTLDNGIYLPDEGERNCYEGLAGNWVALDNHLGSTNIHVTINDKQAWNGHVADTTIHVTSADKQAWDGHVADTVKHVTAEDKQAWNGKADASALTAHTGDTTIHVTSADKQAWNSHIADTVKHVTAEDKAKWDAVTSKADDSAVMHLTGNETVGGIKTFSNDIRISKISSFCNIFSSGYIKGQAPASSLYSGVRFFDDINSGSPNAITGGFEVEYNRDGYNKSYISSRNYAGKNHKSFTVGLRVPNDDIRSIDFLSSVDGIVNLGTSTNKWKTFNGLEPSSLSLPSGKVSDVIDISSYLVNLDGTDNTYTAPANGWIAITMSNSSSVQAYIHGLWGHQVIRPSAGRVRFLMPILKNKTATIFIFGGSIDNARFIPCQGNV